MFTFTEQGNKVFWITPGGKLNKDETYQVAFERELYEELMIEGEL